MITSTFRNVGSELFYSGKYLDAIKFFELAIDTYPNDYLSYFYLGLCYLKNNNNEKALTAMKTALTIDIESANVFAVLGKAFYESGKFETEIHTIHHMLSEESENSTNFINSGIICLFLSQYDEAKKLLEKAKAVTKFDSIDYEYVLKKL